MDYLFSLLQQGLSGIFAITVLLGLLIFVHELGHFLVAVWCGVRVEIFSLGFGKRILEFKHGDTIYCVSAFPLGGYVKMFGDDPSKEISEDLQKVSFLHKPVFQRIAIVLAGPLMNFFFAIFLFFVIAQTGENTVPAILGDISSESPAYAAGLRSGDTISKIDGKEILYWEQLAQIVQNSADRSLRIEGLREGQPFQAEATPTLVKNPNVLNIKEKVGDIEGLSPLSKAAYVGVSDTQSPAWQAGFRSGKVLSVNSTEVKNFREFQRMIEKSSGAVTIEFRPGWKKETPTTEIQLATGPSFANLGFLSAETFIADVKAGTPAAAAGLQPGDHIVEITGEPITTWKQVLTRIKSYKSGEPAISLKVRREGQLAPFQITPRLTTQMNHQGQEENRFQIGIQSGAQLMRPPTVLRTYESTGGGFEAGI